MTLAICASAQPTKASLVTGCASQVVERQPLSPAASRALKNEARNPSGVHGRPLRLTRIMGERRGVASSIALSGRRRRTSTRSPVFDRFKRMLSPS